MIVIGTRQTEALARPSMIPLGIVVAMAVWFIYGYAYRYLTLDSEHFGIFRPRGDWLIVHVAGGTLALLIGPVQFWLGSRGRYMWLHRILGIGYLMSVAVSSVTAIYLSAHTDFGWVFGMGLTSMAIAWIITTGLAVVAIGRYLLEQHREWMIRSYVVTFSFVIFQVLVEAFEMTRTGNMPERLTAASWLCWSVPLLVTEAMLQGRKMFIPELQKPRVAAHYADYADGNTL